MVRLGDKIVRIEAPSERVRRIETLAKKKDCIYYAIRFFHEDRKDATLIKLEELSMETYKQVIKGLNDTVIQKAYDNLIWLMRLGEQPREKLENVTDKLLKLLEAREAIETT